MTITSVSTAEQKANERVRIFGERVKGARTMENRTSGSVAEAIGRSASWYSRIEDSEEGVSVDRDTLRLLSETLRFDEAHFETRAGVEVDRAALCFRAKKSMTKAQVEQVAGWARMSGELIVDLVERTTTVIPLSLPDVTDNPSPELAARRFRELRGLKPHEPIGEMARELEKSGIYIVSAEFANDDDPKHDAVSTWVGRRHDHKYALVMLRPIDSWERTRMSLAHEAGHLVLHRQQQPADREDQAFDFASELLMPQDAMRLEWPARTTLETLLPLKFKWGVSLAALIMRGHKLGLISDLHRRSLFKQLSSRRSYGTNVSWRTREPGAADRPVEKPILLARMLELAFRDNIDMTTLSRMIHFYPERYLRPIVEGQAPITERLHAAIPADATNVTPLRPRTARARG
ncbi:ImmA/IrrE family metallo-endopeptidase [Microbacterium sp. RU33B]|uniref:ImmA/IrrE family metallo-endopeptidase n=1 Tax=Microbacterium sp. RU33B TaxID=1907390 RepID=UPI0009670A31|nr:ImmA/IrrE family metallo-endopeptidase [Microbacterium sp. RU33B]SIT72123.1 Zn-dependent peptidase ImmA, M78 family [Microbacterium sp. RU33B]